MCFVAGALGLTGLAGKLVNASLALSAVTQVAGAAAKNKAARQTASYAYQAAERTALSADAAMSAQQNAVSDRLEEDRAITAQKRLEANIKVLKPKGSIPAQEGKSGRLLGIVLGEEERQGGVMRESLNQSLESAERQYDRDVEGIIAQRESRRNQALDIANRGYMQAQQQYQGLLPTLAGIASTGLKSYLDIKPNMAEINA